MRITRKDEDKINEEIASSCARLMELGCDSVQIIGTAELEGNQCGHFALGAGNIYARHGATTFWLKNQQEMSLAVEIAEAIEG